MRRRIAFFQSIARVLTVFGSLTSLAIADQPEPRESRLRDHVGTLASPGYLGRKGVGGRKSADYLIDAFKKLGLEPLFDRSFEQSIPGKAGEPPMGRNVGAILRGSDPALKDDWIVVSAHYDHLGRRDGVVYPGADDNASGVAMMLEVARSFVEGSEKPRRSLMFLGFDLEEKGLFGSRYFVEHSPVPLAKIDLFITADMIGRALGGVCLDDVFVMGTEHEPALRPWIEAEAKGKGVTVGLLGSDILVLDRSDYGPFRSRKVPYLFFSTGENPFYHTPMDTPETLNYPKLTAISRLILGISRRAAGADTLPRWSASAGPSIEEAATIRMVLRTFLEHREAMKIGSAQATIMTNSLKTLDAIVARGTITPEERVGVVRVARLVLFSVF